MDVLVFRVGGGTGAVAVDYATADDSAIAGADYTAASGTLFWDDGDTSVKRVPVELLPDAVTTEGNETFRFVLSNPQGSAELGASRETVVTIENDADSDGVPDSQDAFPNDPSEWSDADGDGIGDNADLDDDNDGMSDVYEEANGLDPLDPGDAAPDADHDGYTNLEEHDAGTDPQDFADNPGAGNFPQVLPVDDDDNDPDVRAMWSEALDALGLPYDVWNTGNTDSEPDAATLAGYTAVLWTSGMAQGDDFAAGPGTDGEGALETYLAGGGCLVVSSQDYFADKGLTAFMQDSLGASNVLDNTGQGTVSGAGILGGLGPYVLDYSGLTNASDTLTAGTGTTLFDGDRGWRRWRRDRPTIWPLPFEALAGAPEREAVLGAVLASCGVSARDPGQLDMDGDGKSDLLWRNVANGRNVVWFMDGSNRTGAGDTVTVNSPDWEFAGLGDFNGDGRTDFLWRNLVNGRNVIWLMDGLGRVGYGDTVVLNDPARELVTLRDFDGDGKTDFLWCNVNNGRNVMWFMDGTTRTGSGEALGVNDADWSIGGFGDFNGDRRTDFLWRSASTGRNVIWLMDGATRIGSGDTVVLGNPDWTLAGLEDFDGDGKTDFLWRSVSTGRNVMWFMDGVTRTGSGDTLALNDPDWTLTGFGDYNGDRRSDFLWHSESTGRNVMWFMDGTTRIGSGDTINLHFDPWFPRMK
ncbi:MAG: FG-GAP-like repeat-containing protein [Gammaproteobacteria bacterium]|nr:FG-GAP-like repeat-containing protein [Gammaproteobacteria bacterium]